MVIRDFTEIEAWKQARILVSDVYRICNETKLSRDYGLRDQIQRAAVSIMSNIAEGFDSNSTSSFVNFLSYSFRSASEVQSLLFVALDVEYIDSDVFDKLMEQTTSVKKMIGGFIRYLKSKPTK
ncbi:MAG: four helix bundle protein [Candidatus Cloacimonadaceae bacterium]|jgi:four helix bundle protein|nr:four helix bundle protein [Candidatus Cloacimonadota bacterium]MDY0338085.1 four helix bundle protein [Candidatus Cloacimonadaceae bacterium]